MDSQAEKLGILNFNDRVYALAPTITHAEQLVSAALKYGWPVANMLRGRDKPGDDALRSLYQFAQKLVADSGDQNNAVVVVFDHADGIYVSTKNGVSHKGSGKSNQLISHSNFYIQLQFHVPHLSSKLNLDQIQWFASNKSVDQLTVHDYVYSCRYNKVCRAVSRSGSFVVLTYSDSGGQEWSYTHHLADPAGSSDDQLIPLQLRSNIPYHTPCHLSGVRLLAGIPVLPLKDLIQHCLSKQSKTTTNNNKKDEVSRTTEDKGQRQGSAQAVYLSSVQSQIAIGSLNLGDPISCRDGQARIGGSEECLSFTARSSN